MLKSKNVILRSIMIADKPFFLKWLNDPEITKWLLNFLPFSEIETDDWMSQIGREKKYLETHFIIEKTNFGPIGSCSLSQINYKDQDSIMTIYIGEKNFLNQGFATESLKLLMEYGFKQLNLNRISSWVLESNQKSINLLIKSGFKLEGEKRKSFYRNGCFYSRLLFGILKEEYIL